MAIFSVMSHVVMHNREDPSFLSMKTCAMGNKYKAVMTVAPITLDEYPLEQFCHFCMSLKN